MNMTFKSWTSPFTTLLCHRPWTPPSAIAPRLSASQLVEEEKTPYYRPERFYPVQLGQVLHGRYQIATKLGYGSSSTVWLARDLCRLFMHPQQPGFANEFCSWRWKSERYVAIKITSRGPCAPKDDICQELALLKHISKANPRHDGWHFVRKLVDSFHVSGVDGKHACLVFEPMREPLWLYSRRFIGNVIPPNVFKVMLQMILHGLDYLHTECEIIHTDLKPDNVMVKVEDPAILQRDAQDEQRNPLPQKHLDGRIIYLSRNDYGQFSAPTGVVQIVDFDLSVFGNIPRTGCIQADVYRAPEVILDAGYSYSADIWSLGVMLWDLLEGRKLFNVIHPSQNDDYDEHLHLAYITSLLGSPPSELTSARRAHMFYDSNGSFRNPSLLPGNFSFESSISGMNGAEKEMFINFAKRMIRWCPNERSTAKELLEDPWLYTDFPQVDP
ncbi:hypothetical protein AC578_9220 [Pseudocercospora eumusae]|uniref:non-specific serine/threonine protein kinase n=1 Tax=Pseudocercospora eumusae TaxID=321146 RepID=A0A139GTF6_9PEZI|nr:hypothetical protein AC578_9220 [Pseudocercospora eumusae]